MRTLVRRSSSREISKAQSGPCNSKILPLWTVKSKFHNIFIILPMMTFFFNFNMISTILLDYFNIDNGTILMCYLLQKFCVCMFAKAHL